MNRPRATIDANQAVAEIAYQTNEVVSIYPITPASPMGEWADQWASQGDPNLWGTVPKVMEMQSEGGAAGTIHGALQRGSLATTFTASQGLLLMLPNMYKIAGELTPCVIHVAARSVATHALSIFCDHSDVMAARGTGFALLASNSVQEAMDFALIAQTATLEARVPFLHFFDGFRTSHEIAKIEELQPEDCFAMLNEDAIRAHRQRGLSPDHPFIRGTAQNPDVFFQAREAVNPYYNACPELVQNAMDRFAELVGRQYHLFDYVGHPEAERVVVMMGSGAETAEETVNALVDQGEKVGLVKVRLFRPFSAAHFINALPITVRRIAVLDRTKEPGSVGEPLYLDVASSIAEAVTASAEGGRSLSAQVVGGRYGLSSKELTPAMINGVLQELTKSQPKRHFTLGITDDVTHTSLAFDPAFSTEAADNVRAVFYGLGSDGTVGANKNSIKIIGDETEHYVQGYFVYDSKKAGSVTVSHLRFGPKPIHAAYLISQANFVACHQFPFLERFDVLRSAETGGTFLLNSPFGPDQVWDHLPASVQKQIREKQLRFFVIDAYRLAKEAGLGPRINTVMQICFFALTEIFDLDRATAAIKENIYSSYGKRGQAVINKNYAAVDSALEHLHEVPVPDQITSDFERRPAVPESAPEFVRHVTAPMIVGEGDRLPVSSLPPDGTFPSGTTQWEKRNIADEIPVWDPDICIQCGKCVMVCPHSVIRGKLYDPEHLANAPETFRSAPSRFPDHKELRYTLQVAPEDCTGCSLCVEVCPVKNKRQTGLKAINMRPQPPLREQEAENWAFFESLPDFNRHAIETSRVKEVQLMEPLFEFSGACSGCGETPYLKLMSQLFGDRAIIANATGCSSIYGGNLPTTPWTANAEGRGPAWSNSLFEDNAEFGLGMRLALDKQIEYAGELLHQLKPELDQTLIAEILEADQSTEEGIDRQRARIDRLKAALEPLGSRRDVLDLLSLADELVDKSVWIVGGDGWAYDIGYGGLDHVLSSGMDVNVLVLDTEVYSNTGGQQSKATPRGAVAKFAAGGKVSQKKDLGMLAMTYGNIYVANVAMGANDAHTLKVFREAEAYPGPSLILAYSHCIAHGYNLAFGMAQQKAAVQSGYWPLYRYNPQWADEGKNPLHLDSKEPQIPLEKYIYNETRYKMLALNNPDVARERLKEAQEDVYRRWQTYQHLAGRSSEKPTQSSGNGGNQE